MATSATDTDQASFMGPGEVASEASVLLREAQVLAVRVDALLEEALTRSPEPSAYRVRLARAHALGLLDQLANLLTAARGSLASGVLGCGPRHPESGIQAKVLREEPAPSSRVVGLHDDVTPGVSGIRSR